MPHGLARGCGVARCWVGPPPLFVVSTPIAVVKLPFGTLMALATPVALALMGARLLA